MKANVSISEKDNSRGRLVSSITSKRIVLQTWDWPSYEYKQGRIHGYPSRVRVGRGHNLGQWNIWAGAIRPKTPLTLKSKV